jgi:hypothetical protein
MMIDPRRSIGRDELPPLCVATVGRTAGTGGIAGVQGPPGKAWYPPEAEVALSTNRRRLPVAVDRLTTWISKG